MKTSQIHILPVYLFLLLALSCNPPSSNSTKSNSSDVSTEVVSEVLGVDDFEAKMKTKGAQLIDVRTVEEVNEGSIEGSRNIDFYSDNFESQILSLNKELPVLVYCRSGNRSGQTAEMLRNAGFKKIYDLKGGFEEWSSK